MVNSSSQITFLIVVATVSMLCNLVVLVSLWKSPRSTLSSKLVFWLSFTVLIADFLSLPNIFSKDELVCELTTGLRQCLQLASLSICFLMALLAYHLVFIMSWEWMHQWYVSVVIGLCCCIALVPLGYQGYGNVAGYCTFNDSSAGHQWLAILASTEFAINICTILTFLYIIFLMKWNEGRITTAVFKGVGSYAILTIVCFIPKGYQLTHRHIPNALLLTRLFSYIASIGYAAIYYFQQRTLLLFEKQEAGLPKPRNLEDLRMSASAYDSEYSACDSLLEATSIVTL